MQGGGGLSHNNLSLGRKGGIMKSKKQTARGNRATESRGKSQREKIKHPFCFSSFLNHGLGMWSGTCENVYAHMVMHNADINE